MEQEIKFNSREILTKLAKLQADVDYIKKNISPDKDNELKEEMKMWEEASAEDTADFFEKNNL